MSEHQGPGDVTGMVSGDVHGQVAIGKEIRQSQAVGGPASRVSEEEVAELLQAFSDLKAQVAASAPAEARDAALERVGELEVAVTADKPDVTTMEYVKGWFTRTLPDLAGSVTGLLVHPIVGKLVQMAGEGIAGEYERRVARNR